jgi:hypothetical protein
MATSLYEEIREAILTGRFAPGQVLSENALAAEFGKSRTPPPTAASTRRCGTRVTTRRSRTCCTG